MTLTDRRRRVLGAIAYHHGPGAPTYRDIGRVAGLSSVSSVLHQLRALRRDGWVAWEPAVPGSLHLADGVVVWRTVVGVGPCKTCGLSLPDDHHHVADLRVSLEETVRDIRPYTSPEVLRDRLNNPDSYAAETADSTPREDTP